MTKQSAETIMPYSFRFLRGNENKLRVNKF